MRGWRAELAFIVFLLGLIVIELAWLAVLGALLYYLLELSR